MLGEIWILSSMGSGRNILSPDDTNRIRILQQIRTQGSHSFYSHQRVRTRSFQSLHPAPGTAAVRIGLRSRRSTRTAYLHPVHGSESHGGALHPSFVRWGPRGPKPRLSDESGRCGVIDRSSRHTPPSIPGASSNRDRRQVMFLRPRFLGSKEWFHSKIRDAARFSTPL